MALTAVAQRAISAPSKAWNCSLEPCDEHLEILDAVKSFLIERLSGR